MHAHAGGSTTAARRPKRNVCIYILALYHQTENISTTKRRGNVYFIEFTGRFHPATHPEKRRQGCSGGYSRAPLPGKTSGSGRPRGSRECSSASGTKAVKLHMSVLDGSKNRVRLKWIRPACRPVSSRISRRTASSALAAVDITGDEDIARSAVLLDEQDAAGVFVHDDHADRRVVPWESGIRRRRGRRARCLRPRAAFSMSAAPHSQQCFCITMNVLSGGRMAGYFDRRSHLKSRQMTNTASAVFKTVTKVP